jgi:ABC-type nitrate/sulfonate/bicarbonate transport system permease component
MTTQESEMNLPAGAVVTPPAESGGIRSRARRRKRSTFWRVREEIPRSLEVALLILSVLSPLVLWSALSYPELVNPIFLPTPDKVATAGYDMLMDGTLTSDMLASSQRVAIGFGLSLLIAVPLGLGMGTFKSISALFEPVIGLVRYAVPGVIDTARVNLAAAWNLIVVTELFAADEGLGFRIVRSQKFLHIDQIFVAIAVIGLLGLACDLALRSARNKLAPWSQE